MSIFWWVVIITAIAGIGGTGLGGLIGAVLQRNSTKLVSLLLAFAGGVMLSVVCFDLIPGAFRPEGAEGEMPLFLVIGGVVFGYILIYLLNYVIDKHTNTELDHIDDSHPATHDDLSELIHSDHYTMHKKNKGKSTELFVAGVVMACAIALHNMPEGMVIGASYAADGKVVGTMGFVVALVIGLHNIPEGMSVSVPLIAGGMKKSKAIAVTALSGAPTVIGAMIGYSLGLVSPLWLSLALSFAGGAMLYVVLGELLPEALLMWKSKAPGAFVLIGLLVGVILVKV